MRGAVAEPGGAQGEQERQRPSRGGCGPRAQLHAATGSGGGRAQRAGASPRARSVRLSLRPARPRPLSAPSLTQIPPPRFRPPRRLRTPLRPRRRSPQPARPAPAPAPGPVPAPRPGRSPAAAPGPVLCPAATSGAPRSSPFSPAPAPAGRRQPPKQFSPWKADGRRGPAPRGRVPRSRGLGLLGQRANRGEEGTGFFRWGQRSRGELPVSAGEVGAVLPLCGTPVVLPDTGTMRWSVFPSWPDDCSFAHCHGKGVGGYLSEECTISLYL